MTINMKDKPKLIKKKKKKKENALDRVNRVYDTGKTLGILMGKVDSLEKAVSDSKILSYIQILVVVIMLCFLKWGK